MMAQQDDFFFVKSMIREVAHGGDRVVSARDSETSVSSSTPASAIIYDAYSSIINNKSKKNASQSIFFLNQPIRFYRSAGKKLNENISSKFGFVGVREVQKLFIY